MPEGVVEEVLETGKVEVTEDLVVDDFRCGMEEDPRRRPEEAIGIEGRRQKPSLFEGVAEAF